MSSLSYTDLIFQAGPTFAYLIAFAIVFAECGLFFGFFLPGDSLLFPLGLFAAQGRLNVLLLIIICVAASFLGNLVGYWFGRRIGPALFSRPDSRFFKKANLHKAQAFYEKYGKKTIFLARFVPVVRTFAPIVAGIGEMNYSVFLLFNLVSGSIWVVAVTLLGYFLGNTVHNIERYSIPIVLVVALISFLPIITHLHHTSKSK